MSIDWSKRITSEMKNQQQLQADYREWKVDRQQAVEAITVEVDGLVFDGDELSQNRMARAVAAADALTETTDWTLHDNSAVTVTVLQLKIACRLAGEAQTVIWNEGRPLPT